MKNSSGAGTVHSALGGAVMTGDGKPLSDNAIRCFLGGIRWVSVAAAVVPVVALLTGPCQTACAEPATATPIRHLVVIFEENVSFDHYFGTYPHAANTDGEPFFPAAGTRDVNGLSPGLLLANPNAAQPARLGGPAQQLTCDQDHEYRAEQLAFNGGAMDRFVEHTEGQPCAPPSFSTSGLVMDYYDGNTVTALWNYAQYYAISDNSFGTTFGPLAPGHINLVSGQTHGVTTQFMPGGKPFPAGEVITDTSDGQGTLIGDAQPLDDDCSDRDQVRFSDADRTIGDLLTARGVSWGYFQGGFRPTSTRPDGTAVCGATDNVGAAVGGTGTTGALPFGTKPNYIPHHEPFQYFRSTANPHHLPPSSVVMIGRTDHANHQYDMADFWAAAQAGELPAVSFVKPPAFQDAHAGFND